jgi:hypothetical protein
MAQAVADSADRGGAGQLPGGRIAAKACSVPKLNGRRGARSLKCVGHVGFSRVCGITMQETFSQCKDIFSLRHVFLCGIV